MSKGRRAVPFEVKADGLDDDSRTFVGLASTWQKDLGGDVIHRGAFKKTLDEWRKRGSVIPLLDSHASHTVRSAVGKLLDAEETDAGLLATFEVLDGPDGDEVWRRLKGGYVTGLSIGYRPIKVETPTDDEKGAGIWRHLKEVALEEVSVVMWPMNPGARIDAASLKALCEGVRELKALDDLGEATIEQLRQLRALIDEILAEAGEADEEEFDAGVRAEVDRVLAGLVLARHSRRVASR